MRCFRHRSCSLLFHFGSPPPPPLHPLPCFASFQPFSPPNHALSHGTASSWAFPPPQTPPDHPLSHGTDSRTAFSHASSHGTGSAMADVSNFAALIRGCCHKPDPLEEGKRIHGLITQSGLHQDMFLCNLLISMYGKCRALDDAREVFDHMPRKNILSWTSLLRVYADNAKPKQAFDLFHQMMEEGVNPNKYAFYCLLQICSGSGSLVETRKAHEWIEDSGVEVDVALGNALMNAYWKCGSLVDACRVFDNMPQRDVVSWTTLIDAYAKLGYFEHAFAVFREMQTKGVKPNRVTIVAVLNACNSPAALAFGRRIHAYIVEAGAELHLVGWTALVNMYGKCGSLPDALKVFNEMPEHNQVSWNTLISAYARNGKVKEMLDCLDQMKLAGMSPNKNTFTTMLIACSSPDDLSLGSIICDEIMKSRVQVDVVLGTALIRMFDKCGSIDDARRIFDAMTEKNVLTWTSMIGAYCQSGKQKEAFDIYDRMQQEGFEPDKLTYVSLLDACASLSNLEDGKLIHQHILQRGFDSDFTLATALLSMYAKCGSRKDAHMLFNSLDTRDIIAWNALFTAYAKHGHGVEALQFCSYMQWNGVKPNEATIVSLVSVCSRAGLFEEGYNYFGTFENVGSISTLGSYRCIIDLLARSGHLDKAEQVILTSPFMPDTSLWMVLLSACKVYDDRERGKRVSEKILDLASDKAAAYAMLTDIYAMDGNSDDVLKVREFTSGIAITEHQRGSSIAL